MQKNQLVINYGDQAKKMVKELLKKIKIEDELESNDLIALKPNLINATKSDQGATTDPEIVKGVIEYLQAKGFNNLMIIEGSWVGADTDKAFEVCGYKKLARDYEVLCGFIVYSFGDGVSDIDIVVRGLGRVERHDPDLNRVNVVDHRIIPLLELVVGFLSQVVSGIMGLVLVPHLHYCRVFLDVLSLNIFDRVLDVIPATVVVLEPLPPDAGAVIPLSHHVRATAGSVVLHPLVTPVPVLFVLLDQL